MVSKKRLHSGDDSSASDISGLNGQVTPPSPLSPVLKSPEKLDSNHEENSSLLRSRKKRKATLASFSPASVAPDTKKYWSKDEELAILKGIVAYRNSTGLDYLSDSAAFLRYIKDDIDGEASKDQLVSKIRKLKQRFQDNLVKKRCFTNSQDSETFDLSMAIWGKDKAGSVNGNMNKPKRSNSKVRASLGHEVVTDYEPGKNDGSSAKVRTFVELDDEPGNDDGSSAKSDSWDKLPCENVDKSKESEEVEAVTNGEHRNDDGSTKDNSCDNILPPENVEKPMAGRKKIEEIEAITNSEPKNDDGATKSNSMLPPANVEKHMENVEDDEADDLCCLQDALEATMFQHLSNHAQKLMLQNLRNFKAKERKELSDEWKSLLVEEMILKSKKQSFSAKLVKATLRD